MNEFVNEFVYEFVSSTSSVKPVLCNGTFFAKSRWALICTRQDRKSLEQIQRNSWSTKSISVLYVVVRCSVICNCELFRQEHQLKHL